MHPVHVQTVAWVAELKNTLSAMFFLASAFVFVGWFRREPRMWPGYLLGMVLFVCALLSKSATCLLPAALLVVLWWKRPRLERRDLLALAPLFAVGLSFVLVTVYLEAVHGGASGGGFSQPALERALVAGRALWFYAGKLVWPAELIFIYPRWIRSGLPKSRKPYCDRAFNSARMVASSSTRSARLPKMRRAALCVRYWGTGTLSSRTGRNA